MRDLRAFHSLWGNIQTTLAVHVLCSPLLQHLIDRALGLHHRFVLFTFRSPLLGESRLFSIPCHTKMFHFWQFPIFSDLLRVLA